MQPRIAVIAVLATATLAQAQVPSPSEPPEPPRVAVVPPSAPVRPDQARRFLEQALAESGAEVVAPREYRATERRLGAPTTRERAGRFADALELDGLVRVQIQRPAILSMRGYAYEAEVELLGPDGEVEWQSTLPLRRGTLTREDARQVARLTVEALAAPAGTELIAPPSSGPPVTARPAPAPPPATIPGAQPPARTAERPTATTATPPASIRSRALLDRRSATVEPTLSLRFGETNPFPGQAPLDFSTGVPYGGVRLSGEVFPFDAGGARGVGLGASYSLSALRVTFPDLPGDPDGAATEHRLELDVIGRTPEPWRGVVLGVRLGLGWQAFLVDSRSSLTPTEHFSPRLAVEAGYALPWQSVEVSGLLGVRPLSVPGDQLTAQYGERDSSTGWEGRAQVSGALPRWARGLRWVGGYDFLAYYDEFGPSAPFAEHSETYHRVTLGLAWQKGAP